MKKNKIYLSLVLSAFILSSTPLLKDVHAAENTQLASISQSELKDDSAVYALEQINRGKFDISYYDALGFTYVHDVDNDFLNCLNDYIKYIHDLKGSDLTIDEVSNGVDKFYKNAKTAFKNITEGNGRIQDFELFGILKEGDRCRVIFANRILSRYYHKNPNDFKYSSIKTNYLLAMDTIKQINKDNITTPHYEAFGIPDINEKGTDFINCLSDYIKFENKLIYNNESLNEIIIFDMIHDFYSRADEVLKNIIEGNGKVQDFEYFGIALDKERLSFVNSYIAEYYDKTNTLRQYSQINSLAKEALDLLSSH